MLFPPIVKPFAIEQDVECSFKKLRNTDRNLYKPPVQTCCWTAIGVGFTQTRSNLEVKPASVAVCTPLRGKSAKLSTFFMVMTYKRKLKVASFCSHTGGANVILPVVRRLLSDGLVDVSSYCSHPATEVFDRERVPYVSADGLSMDIERYDLFILGEGVSDEGLSLEQQAIIEGKDKDIFCLSVSDFWTGRTKYYSSDQGRLDILPDKIGVIDDIQRSIMRAEGFPEDLLEITGSPYFESLVESAEGLGDRIITGIRQKYLGGNDVLVFYAGQLEAFRREEYGFYDVDVLNVLDDCSERLDFSVVVKPHPSATARHIEELSDFFDRSRLPAVLTRSEESYKLCLASDLVVTPFSTVGVEALVLGRPVLSLQPGLSTSDNYGFLASRDIVPVGYTRKQCRYLVERALTDKRYLKESSRDDLVRGMNHDATESVVSRIYEQAIP